MERQLSAGSSSLFFLRRRISAKTGKKVGEPSPVARSRSIMDHCAIRCILDLFSPLWLVPSYYSKQAPLRCDTGGVYVCAEASCSPGPGWVGVSHSVLGFHRPVIDSSNTFKWIIMLMQAMHADENKQSREGNSASSKLWHHFRSDLDWKGCTRLTMNRPKRLAIDDGISRANLERVDARCFGANSLAGATTKGAA